MTVRNHRFTSWIVSASLAFSSLTGMHVQAQNAADESPCNSTVLAEDLVTLLNRASYPDIARRGTTGMPSAGEMADAQKRVFTLKRNLEKGFAGRLTNSAPELCFSQGADTEPELVLLKELEKYFEVVSRYEGLKIMLGQTSDPETWESLYNLKFPLKDLSQGRFLEVASTYAQNAVLLPVEGYDRDKLLPLIQSGSFYVSHIEQINGEWQLTFRLNPSFAATAERLAFLMRPSLKSSLQFAAHFSMHRLYDSLILTRTLRRQDPDQLPAPAQEGRDRFLSLKVARFEARRMYQTQFDEIRKPEAFKKILDAAETSGFWALDTEFFTTLAELKGEVFTPFNEEQTKAVQKEETATFSRSLSALLNLMDLTDWKGLPHAMIWQAKRLSLRALYLGNPEARAKLSAEAQTQLAAYIDQRAYRYANEVMGKTKLDLTDIGKLSIQNMMLLQRHNFQQRLEKAAAIVRDFREEEIQIAHILGAQSPFIDALEPSAAIKEQVAALGALPDYGQAYAAYMSRLNALLSEYTLTVITGRKQSKTVTVTAGNDGKPAQESVRKMTIDQIREVEDALKWNPKAFAGKIPDKYINVMNRPGAKGWLWDDPSSRQKDLFDWLYIGQLLKFNVYETLGGVRPLVKNMKLDNTIMGPITQMENRAYQTEVKKTLINDSPLLGGRVEFVNAGPRGPSRTTKEIWEILADKNKTPREKALIVEKQLPKVEELINRNQAQVAAQLAKVDAVQGEDVSGLSDEMRVVATRASQIVQGIETYASFQSYFAHMREELLQPGLLRSEWERFSTAANGAGLWMGVLMAAQLANGRLGPAGKLTGQIGKLITPFCGPNMKCVGTLFMGLIGVGMSEQAARGFYFEPHNLEVVRRYFECGSGAPCIAIYTDVTRQTDVQSQPRMQMATSIISLGLIMGGFYGARKAIAYFTAPGKNAVLAMNRDLEVLGLRADTSFSADALKFAARDALAKARLQTDAIARAQAEAYIMQTYARAEATLREEAASWQAFFLRNKTTFEKLGLNKNNWNDADAVTRAFDGLESAYKGGRMLRSDYQERMGALISLNERLQPLWSQMEKQPVLIGYYQRVFQLAGQSSDVALRAAQRGFNADVSQKFLQKMDEFYGQNNSYRIDTILQNIAKEVKDTPALRTERVNVLKRYMETEMGK